MSEQQQVRSEESLRHEYTEIVTTARHYANLRFAVFSIFFAVIAGAGILAFGKGQFDQHAALVGRVAGIFVIAVFWIYEERLTKLMQHFIGVAIELEHTLGYASFATAPLPFGHGRFPFMTVVLHLFFSLFALLWLYAAIVVPLGR